MLAQLIRAKLSVPHEILLAEFAVPPIQIEATLQLITYIQRVQALLDMERCHTQLALSSSLISLIRAIDYHGSLRHLTSYLSHLVFPLQSFPQGHHSYGWGG
ncbi:hypothetical protein O6H91_Y519900 [Diphasiastrum complanatum]|nr:hypothetical protein O6H91_Y519900 [Diphasiastrum complanatum]